MENLLSQNTELRRIGVWNWSLPAYVVQRSDGSYFNACPMAGACAKVCYARQGSYLFRATRAAHLRHLEMVLEDLAGWQAAMCAELALERFRGGKHVRIHDAGDFFSDEYLQAWLAIAAATPDVTFYAYTKEVSRFKRLVENRAPANFRYLYSLGGKEDALIDPDVDRHAEVFPDLRALEAAGYTSQEESDLQAIYLPTTRIGIVANNIAGFRKRQGRYTFAVMQARRAAGLDKPPLQLRLWY